MVLNILSPERDFFREIPRSCQGDNQEGQERQQGGSSREGLCSEAKRANGYFLPRIPRCMGITKPSTWPSPLLLKLEQLSWILCCIAKPGCSVST